MKTPFMLLTALFVSASTIQAQKKLTIEPQLGTAMSPIKGLTSEGTAFKPSLQAGIGIGYQFNDRWSFKTGPYVANGYALYADTLSIDPLGALGGLLGNALSGANLIGEEYVEGRSSFWNVDIPITVQYTMESNVFFRFGVYGSYMFANTNKESITTHVPLFELFQLDQLGLNALSGLFPKNGTREEVNQSKENMNTTGWGGLISMGYEGKRWIFNCGYQYAFSDIRTDDKFLNINHRQAIQMTIGYRFLPDFTSSHMKPKYDLDLIQ